MINPSAIQTAFAVELTYPFPAARVFAAFSHPATAALTPESGGTRLTYDERGTFLAGVDQAVAHESGWRGLLDRLDAELRCARQAA